MSGISGVTGEGGEEPLLAMLEDLEHRGPDQQVLLPGDSVSLGIDGLIVTDQDRVSGPSARAGELEVVVDGRIYNREQLLPQAEHLTEAEAVLALYSSQGSSFLSRAQGMFALAIRDGSELLVARDPLGIKPLYYGELDGQFFFASEIKGLSGLALECELHEFPPGWLYHSSEGWKRYDAAPVAEWHDGSPDEAAQLLRQTLEHTMQRYLEADVPIGFFLSGGLDSSAVAALAARQQRRPLVTFAVGTEESHDLEQARFVADYLGCEHHEVIYDQEVVQEVLDDVLYHLESFDAAFVRGSLPNYLVARQAAQAGIKVVFSGEGADEFFAGYRYLKDLSSPVHVRKELDRLVQGLHNSGLQRVDRMTAAHGMECRLPFLDHDITRLAQQLPLEWKLHAGEDGQVQEKWILRRAVDDLLPQEIVWRPKEQFSEGSGSDRILEQACRELSQKAGRQDEGDLEDVPLRSEEERYYYQRFHHFYPQEEVLETVGRWLQSL